MSRARENSAWLARRSQALTRDDPGGGGGSMAEWRPVPVDEQYTIAQWSDGVRLVSVELLVMGTARLHVGPVGVLYWDDSW